MQTSLSKVVWKAPTVKCFRLLHSLVGHVAALVRLELVLHPAPEGIRLYRTSPGRHPVSGMDTGRLPDAALQLSDAVVWIS